MGRMLILLTILFLSAAASAYFYFSNRRNNEKELGYGNVGYVPETTNLRPLFEPTAEELEADRAAFEEQERAFQAEKADSENRERISRFRRKLDAWRETPTKAGLADLFYAAQGDGELFAEAADTIADKFHKHEIADLSADALAALLESHFWLIPAAQRTPATKFRIGETLNGLRENTSEGEGLNSGLS